MKFFSTLLLSFIFLLSSGVLSAQVTEGPYYEAMKKNVVQLDSSIQQDALEQLVANFERIANVETDKWLPHYYISFCYGSIAYLESDLDKVDEWCDRAIASLETIEQVEGHDPAEVLVIRAFIDYARIKVNYMVRGRDASNSALNHLATAVQVDPTNPRAYAMLSQHYFNVPAQMGGDQDKGCHFAGKALEMFDQNLSDAEGHYRITPHWGQGDIIDLSQRFCRTSDKTKK